MFVMKVFVFLLACIAAKLMITTGDCIDIQGQRNFNFKDYAGVWHARYLSRTLLPFFAHFSADKQVVNDEVIINGFLLPVQSVVGRYASVRGRYRIPDDNSSLVQFQFLHPFSAFNGNYTLISDYDCYLITHGCSREHGIGSTSLGFRDENPSKECEEAAIAAFERSGLTFTKLMGPDPIYHKTRGSNLFSEFHTPSHNAN